MNEKDATGRLRAIVTGTVQGVGYRWFAQREAARLGLVGWVSNRSDGSVEVVVEGPLAALADMEAALRRGPAAARVRSFEAHHEPPRGRLTTFEVRSGAHGGD